MASPQVDPYRFVDPFTRRIIKAWIAREPEPGIPWTPPAKPLARCTVALVSTAGIALKGDRPFDQEGERQNPWWGDPSCRVIPRDATEKDVRLYHLHIDTSFATQDLDCVLPLRRLGELQAGGEIGQVAPSHYSFMGYILRPAELLREHVPPVVERLRQEEVDLALLVPV